MAQSDDKMRSNMERVLRAMDVIPPFDDKTPQGPAVGPEDAAAEAAKRPSRKRSAGKTPDKGVPTLDLGEKILAEQRRVTAGKRRGPGAGRQTVAGGFHEIPAVSEEAPAIPGLDDLTELQGIVADIVARDIEQLCTGPQRSLA